MALPYASSSSSTMISQDYDVFMSFRGEDTRMGFTSHLYEALIRNDFRTYKDDKSLEVGRPIASELLEAIECSRIAVVVLSESFATSKWCLEEVAKIVDCVKQDKLIVIPIFYHVDPSSVRRQSGCFEQGFASHEKNPEIAQQKVETWRVAFRELGALSGFHVTQHRDEAEVVYKIVSKIKSDLPDTVLPIDLHNSLVGIGYRVDEMKGVMRMDSSEVLFVGICGMSGIGKTTLAEVVYQGIKNKFEKCSFIENIKDISKQNDSTGLCKLQQKLLDDLLKEKSTCVRSVADGQALLASKLRSSMVLIILDDVNHPDQLTYLAGAREWFGPGTRIIVTTTNTHLLNLHNIHDIYLCEEMRRDEALSLFCQSAFKQSHPAHGYEKLSDDIVKLSGGLPLALNVYGSILCGKDESYWEDMSKKLKEYPEKEVLGRLEVVYARLDDDQRDAFIYIACFLKGRNKDLVRDILISISLDLGCGITDLMNKCLITINFEDNVWMHDLLQQMCWKILHKESDRYDGKHIAIKYHKDIVDVLSSSPKGAQTLEVINQEPYKGEVNDLFNDPKCFSKMTKLKFLRISNVHFPKGLQYLSSDLRILEWYGCSLKSLPSIFKPKHLCELEMCSSKLKSLWKKDLELPNLRYVNLSFSKNLTKIPDMTSSSNLLKLNLEGCTNLRRLHESVLLQKRLHYLNLKGCASLQSLGRSCMEMEALEALLLSGCSKLECLPEFGSNMKRLEHLYVDGTTIKKLPESLAQMCDLRNLDASGTFIEELPFSVHHFQKLRFLHVNGCHQLPLKPLDFSYLSLDTPSSSLRDVDLSYCNLSVVPDSIGLLCNLLTLNLSGNEFVTLPASIGLLSKLRMLCLNNCKRLQSFPKLSLVDEDMDYGPRSRFHYYVSKERVDVSEFHSPSYDNHPTVSCLNCPNLVMDKRGGYIAEQILHGYLQLRTKYWMTPEAVIQIAGVGSEIPSGFVQPGSEGLILEGPWIGVAICAVISAHHVDDYMEDKYTVTTRIHLGDKLWKIAVPVRLSVAVSETQLMFYWTEDGDLQRIVGSSQKRNFGVAFSVEADSNLRVTKYGVRFIDEEYMTSLKRDEVYISMWYYPPRETDPYILLVHYMDYCKDDTHLHHHIAKILDFILEYGSQEDSLHSIYQFTKSLVEINQELFSLFKGKGRYRDSVQHYCRLCCFSSELYSDFVRSLKNVNEGWLSVKSALEQIVIKSRTKNYNYKEMLQQLNDLEAATSVEYSYKFIRMLEYVFRKIFQIMEEAGFRPTNDKQQQVFRKSSILIVGVLCVMVLCIDGFKLLEEMNDMPINPLLQHLVRALGGRRRYYEENGRLTMKKSTSLQLQISVFYKNKILLQELGISMSRSTCFTKDNEEEMRMVIDKLHKNIQKTTCTIQDMGAHADQYRHDVMKVWNHVEPISQFSQFNFVWQLLRLFVRC